MNRAPKPSTVTRDRVPAIRPGRTSPSQQCRNRALKCRFPRRPRSNRRPPGQPPGRASRHDRIPREQVHPAACRPHPDAGTRRRNHGPVSQSPKSSPNPVPVHRRSMPSISLASGRRRHSASIRFPAASRRRNRMRPRSTPSSSGHWNQPSRPGCPLRPACTGSALRSCRPRAAYRHAAGRPRRSIGPPLLEGAGAGWRRMDPRGSKLDPRGSGSGSRRIRRNALTPTVPTFGAPPGRSEEARPAVGRGARIGNGCRSRLSFVLTPWLAPCSRCISRAGPPENDWDLRRRTAVIDGVQVRPMRE